MRPMRATKAELDTVKWHETSYIAKHEYFLAHENKELFKKMAADIKESKIIGIFKGRKYRYLLRNGYRYWRIENVINRAKHIKFDAKEGEPKLAEESI